MNVFCLLFGHKYRILRPIDDTTRELFCKRCLKEFGMNDDSKMVLPLDDELKKAHKSMLEWQQKYGNPPL